MFPVGLSRFSNDKAQVEQEQIKYRYLLLLCLFSFCQVSTFSVFLPEVDIQGEFRSGRPNCDRIISVVAAETDLIWTGDLILLRRAELITIIRNNRDRERAITAKPGKNSLYHHFRRLVLSPSPKNDIFHSSRRSSSEIILVGSQAISSYP